MNIHVYLHDLNVMNNELVNADVINKICMDDVIKLKHKKD